MATSAIENALAAVRRNFGEPQGLMASLDADAVWVRANDGEWLNSVSRLLELWVGRDLEPVPAHDVLGRLAEGWSSLTDDQARSIELLADTLWIEALTTHPSDPSADMLLGELTYLQLPMVRWLEPWIESLDGPGAQQLADAIIRPSNTRAWAGQRDARGQLEAWAASEPVVMGLAVVGGVHLNEGDFAELLDRLV